MTVDPIAQLSLCLWAFFGGIAFGLAADLGKIVRILLGAYLPPVSWRERYERPLPWLSRGVGWQGAAPRRIWVRIVGVFFDLAFPMLSALYLLLVIFRFNSGAFRLSTVFLFLLGLALFRVLFSARLSGAFALLAFLLAVLGVYVRTLLLVPPKFLWRMARMLLILPLVRLWRAITQRFAIRRTRLMCELQLAAAGKGFCQSPRKNRKRKLKSCRKKEKRVAVSHR